MALTLVGTIANSDDARVEIWRLIAPDTGTYDVVVTFSADLLQEGFAGVVTFTGVHQTTPLPTFASAAGDGITATVDVSSATGELVFEVLAAEYSTSATVGAGQTERWNIFLSNSLGAGSTEPGGSYSKLNRRLIPGLLSSVVGQQYTYVDRDVTRSVLYFYMLEDVDLDGTRTMHGPISVDRAALALTFLISEIPTHGWSG
ncbi:MAG: hypothetical protein GQ476_01560 [Candidatus Aminicenantes bacterium]|nr:hypothetical protein [Candidatus Aminicenantes bacterium]